MIEDDELTIHRLDAHLIVIVAAAKAAVHHAPCRALQRVLVGFGQLEVRRVLPDGAA